MSGVKRPFNQAAYDAHDNRNKEELLKIMKRRGYEIVGDIKEGHFKKYDLKFRHTKNWRRIKFRKRDQGCF